MTHDLVAAMRVEIEIFVKSRKNFSRKFAKKITGWHMPSSLIELPVCEENTILKKKTKVRNKKILSFPHGTLLHNNTVLVKC
jgi:hypothetical protein